MENLLTVPNFAKELQKQGYKKRTSQRLYQLIQDNKLTCITFNNVKFIPVSELEKFKK